MGMLTRLQDWLFPPPPQPPPPPPPPRSDRHSVQELLSEHDRELNAIEEIVSTIRRSPPSRSSHPPAGGSGHGPAVNAE